MIQIRHPSSHAPGARFACGDLVRHRRYGYRGVVVDLDASCRAPDGWYLSNSSQPDRAQPWYHVLVHGSHQTTYAAEENLAAEPEPAEVAHPLVAVFFDGYAGGRYVRNERPFEGWPGSA